METMTLMPMATDLVLTARALPNTAVRAPWTIGMPGHVDTNVHVIAQAAVASCKSRLFGTKAYGTRRLGEHAST